jgi:hypothetical protein
MKLIAPALACLLLVALTALRAAEPARMFLATSVHFEKGFYGTVRLKMRTLNHIGRADAAYALAVQKDNHGCLS